MLKDRVLQRDVYAAVEDLSPLLSPSRYEVRPTKHPRRELTTGEHLDRARLDKQPAGLRPLGDDIDLHVERDGYPPGAGKFQSSREPAVIHAPECDQVATGKSCANFLCLSRRGLNSSCR